MALRLLPSSKPDVVIMDISMPGMNGVQATAHIHELYPDIIVLALTRHSDANYARQIMQAGAQGYILKQAAARDLLVAIRTAATGGMYLDPTVAGRMMGIGTSQQASGAAPGQDLSERETEVIRRIAFGYSNKEIAAELNLSVKTVDTYKARAMEKLHLYSRTALVRYALEQGWLTNL
jgi:two-component system response regulator NreC